MPPVADNTPVSALKNLGPASTKALEDIDVFTAGDIRKLGIPLLFHILKQRWPGVNMNLVYAVEAGLRDIHWLELSADEKSTLRAECKIT